MAYLNKVQPLVISVHKSQEQCVSVYCSKVRIIRCEHSVAITPHPVKMVSRV
jgi:hypothetical protein